MLKIIIPGDPVTKKNHGQIVKNRRTGKPKLLPSKQYIAYEAGCWEHLHKYRHEKINQKVNIKCLYYMRTRRIVDLVGLLQATDDILTKYGVIDDDNSRIVGGHDGSRVFHDKENPRVEITITPLTKIEVEIWNGLEFGQET